MVPGNGHCTPGIQSRRRHIDHTPHDSIAQWKKKVIRIVLVMVLMRENSTAGCFLNIIFHELLDKVDICLSLWVL